MISTRLTMETPRLVLIFCSLMLGTGLLATSVMAAPTRFIPSTNQATLSRQRAVINFGRNFGTNLGNTLVRNIHSFNHRIFTNAGSPQRAGLSTALAGPLRLGATASNLFAPALVRNHVTLPIHSASTNIANWLGYFESNLARFSPSTGRTTPSIH